MFPKGFHESSSLFGTSRWLAKHRRYVNVTSGKEKQCTKLPEKGVLSHANMGYNIVTVDAC